MTRIRMRVEMEGADAAKRKLRALPREAQDGARAAAGRIADMLAAEVTQAARAEGGIAAQIADAAGTTRDRFPNVKFPGSQSATFTSSSGSHRVRDVIFGAEFGGQGRSRTMQFRPHTGTTGRWFFPTVRAKADEIGELWNAALDDWADEWNQAGQV